VAQDGQEVDGGNPWWSLELALAELRAGEPQAALGGLWVDVPAVSPFLLSPIDGDQGFFRVKIDE
jgi:hypothetical protein